jgi:hypothetical protein
VRLSSRSDGRGKPLGAAVAEWAAANPDIQRVWMAAAAAPDQAIELLAELQPSADSEEALGVWMANAGRWRRELQARLDQPLRLDWFDPDGATRPDGEAKTLIYARV